MLDDFADHIVVAGTARRTYRRDLAILEGAVDAEELKLAVDVGLLHLLHHGLVDGGRHVWRGYVKAPAQLILCMLRKSAVVCR